MDWDEIVCGWEPAGIKGGSEQVVLSTIIRRLETKIEDLEYTVKNLQNDLDELSRKVAAYRT